MAGQSGPFQNKGRFFVYPSGLVSPIYQKKINKTAGRLSLNRNKSKCLQVMLLNWFQDQELEYLSMLVEVFSTLWMVFLEGICSVLLGTSVPRPVTPFTLMSNKLFSSHQRIFPLPTNWKKKQRNTSKCGKKSKSIES